jgi:DNA-binding response OmpR family regulator
VEDDSALRKDWEDLLTRLHRLFRRSSPRFGERSTETFSGPELDLDGDHFTIDGRRVRLAPKELELFRIFVSCPGITHPHSFLWGSVWGRESDACERTLKATVSSLRRKLGRKWGARISSRSYGYVFDPSA